MRCSSKTTLDTILRRRRQLSFDYELYTDYTLRAYRGDTPRVGKALFRCLAAARRQVLPHYFIASPQWRLWIRKFVKKRAMPDFCIIGPTKSGTSDLAVTIMSHPNVLCPLVKEPPSDNPATWRPYYPTLGAVNRYAQRHGIALCAFVAPYLHFVDLPIALSQICPDTKIIINLRNPADLVFSSWKWHVLHADKQFVENSPFAATFTAYVSAALEVFPAAAAPFCTALHNGIYAGSVRHWLRAFGERNVRIFDIAEYFRDRNSYFDRLQQFLNLPSVALPPRLPVANRNPLQDLAPDPTAFETLRKFFAPYNRQLWSVIGTSYSW